MKAHVETLITKAANADKSEDAMRFSQAAVNASNAVNALFYLDHHAAELANQRSTQRATN